MGWMGKVIGGTIGFALGGPLGAIAGASFGHAYDRSNELDRQGGFTRLSADEQSQMTFFVAVFSMLAKLARADGNVSKEEIDTIERIMDHELRLSPQSRNVAVNIFQTALNSTDTFEDYAGQFYQQFHSQPQILEFMIDILFRVSTADGNLSLEEERLIEQASQIFRFGDARYRQIRSRYADDLDRYYATLGTNRGDTDGDIKTAYRQLVSEYHPDKIASKGLPEEFTTFANEKFREIQEAYEKVKEDRNMK